MANFLHCDDDYSVNISNWQDIEKTTFYTVSIRIRRVEWNVQRRYNEFDKLHHTLVADHGVAFDIFPPKKALGNREEAFIEKRRSSLEIYLQQVVRFLQKSMPNELAEFLHLNKFDVSFIVKNMAIEFYEKGEVILAKQKTFTFNPLQLLAINERLKQPCSRVDLQDQREDFSHVLDFCYHLTDLTVEGSEKEIPTTNIVTNTLPLQFTVFKSLESLSLVNCSVTNISELGSLRFTLKQILVNGGRLENLADLILCDQVHKTEASEEHEWKKLNRISISKTTIANLDYSVKYVPFLNILALDNNQINDVNNVNNLKQLVHLSLANNRLQVVPPFQLPKLCLLNIQRNNIVSLEAFSNLHQLETLNLQMNRISDVTEVRHIANLPSLENLNLTGNPVSQIVDYRVKVLVYFGNRGFRMCLDNESTNQKELDKVAILKALHSSETLILHPPT